MKLQRSGLIRIVFIVIICFALCSCSYTSVTGWEIKKGDVSEQFWILVE